MDRKQELEQIKTLIKQHYSAADGGLFDSRNLVGDYMTNLYTGKYFDLDICYGWNYFEVFGTTECEFNSLLKFYESLSN